MHIDGRVTSALVALLPANMRSYAIVVAANTRANTKQASTPGEARSLRFARLAHLRIIDLPVDRIRDEE
jgi:hypothetical protein